MKKVAFTLSAFLTAALILAFVRRPQPATPFDVTAYKQKSNIQCSPDWNKVAFLLDKVEIMPMPGAGTYNWKISTTSDSAQFYFNQGINMYYGFHIIEAMASFKKAARFDPESPMVWWAQALAYGPNINDVRYNALPQALETTTKAASLINKATPVEKALIAAMQVRYSTDSTQKRETLNQAYADAMKQAYTVQPTDPDVVALYADALMLQHPWDFWTPEGKTKPWTPEVRDVLEKAIQLQPQHPGANHYYIHVMEPSPEADKALPSANRLGTLTPGLSHMVHMPSHIYLRTGEFNKGAAVNEEAIKKFQQYSTLFPAVTEGAFLYQWHNQHMQVNCDLLAGRYAHAYSTALALQKVIDSATMSSPAPDGSLVQYIHMVPVLVNVRFEKWDSLLAMPKPATNHVYASILYHFGRGMGLAAKNDVATAQDEAAAMQRYMENGDLKIAMHPFSPAIDGARSALEILSGFIKLKQANHHDAIAHFTKAVEQEQAMVYNEPRDWLLNPAPYLGSAYLKAKQYKSAEQAFKKDLMVNARNVWSLHGLQQALAKQQKKTEAQRIEKQLKKAAEKSDINLRTMMP